MNDTKLAKLALDKVAEKKTLRSTFYLSKITLEKIEKMKKVHNLKPKDLFDSICLDEEIVEVAIGFGESTEWRSKIINNPKNKTFVISKQAYNALNEIAKDYNLSRNKLVDHLVFTFVGLIEIYIKKEKEKETKALAILKKLSKSIDETDKQLNGLLDEDSPIISRFGYVQDFFGNLVGSIKSKLTDGQLIDPHDFSQN